MRKLQYILTRIGYRDIRRLLIIPRRLKQILMFTQAHLIELPNQIFILAHAELIGIDGLKLLHIIFIISRSPCMDNEQREAEITIINLLQKIREIDKAAAFNVIQAQGVVDFSNLRFEAYFKCLAKVEEELARYRLQQDQYKKLQLALQRQETQNRKKIGIEQQLKIYTDALKIQVEEIQKEKMELLENSKAYIKSLKQSNEQLYADLCKARKSKPDSPQKMEKSKENKSLSHHKPKHEKSIRQIIKTEHIERNHSNSANKKKPKSKKQAYSTISAHQTNYGLHQNSKTFHVASQSNKKEKIITQGSKKRNKFLFSNYTLLNYLESSSRKLKKQQRPIVAKSPLKTKKQGKYTSTKWKEKKPNKSVLSFPSPQPNSNKKQTI